MHMYAKRYAIVAYLMFLFIKCNFKRDSVKTPHLLKLAWCRSGETISLFRVSLSYCRISLNIFLFFDSPV